MNTRIDALGYDFSTRIEQVYQLLLPEKQCPLRLTMLHGAWTGVKATVSAGWLILLTDDLGVIWLEIKASEARAGKRLDELREDTREQRSDLKSLGAKVDCLVESVLVARQS